MFKWDTLSSDALGLDSSAGTGLLMSFTLSLETVFSIMFKNVCFLLTGKWHLMKTFPKKVLLIDKYRLFMIWSMTIICLTI